MVFVYCENCGHNKHEDKCDFESYIGNCTCNNYKENQISNVRELEKQIQIANETDKTFRNKKRESQTVDTDEWFRTHLKLRALDDRWFRHYGLWNYHTSEPI